MKFQGDIVAIAITDVAQNLASNRKAGTLTIRRGGEIRHIAFQEGKIVSYTDNLGFSVPKWFLDKGLVGEEVLRKALGKARKSRKKGLGAYLADARAVDEQEYLSTLKALVQDVLYETFTLRDGTFEFHEGQFDPENLDRDTTDAGLELPVGPVLIESARRLDDWEAIRKSLPPANDIYQVPPAERAGRLHELAEDEVAQAAVKLLDGTRTIREVIAAIPASRFDASRAIADLINQKWARPLDGNELLQQVGACNGPAEKSKALLQLKAALEREPGNRALLKKVAELSNELGNKEESAVFRKLLAPALLEDGDREGAEKELRQSLALNPKDIGVWQKLYDLLESKGDERALYGFGCEMAKHLQEVGLAELARDHLVRMLERFPAQLQLRFSHAETLFALGDRAGAVEALLNLSRDLLKKGAVDDGERALAKVLEYDREHKRAREIYEKIRSGKLARHRARRRFIIRAVLAMLLMAGIGLFLGYDLFVRREWALATRQVFADGLIERGEYDRALERLRKIEERHRLSLLRFLEGREVLRTLEEAARKKAGAIEPKPIGASPSPPAPGAAGAKKTPETPRPAPEAGQKKGGK